MDVSAATNEVDKAKEASVVAELQLKKAIDRMEQLWSDIKVLEVDSDRLADEHAILKFDCKVLAAKGKLQDRRAKDALARKVAEILASVDKTIKESKLL